jgi:hypothetical protein
MSLGVRSIDEQILLVVRKPAYLQLSQQTPNLYGMAIFIAIHIDW